MKINTWHCCCVVILIGGGGGGQEDSLAEVEPPLTARGLRRLPSRPGAPTALGACPWDSCGGEVIDHMYASADLALVRGLTGGTAEECCSAVGALPPPPQGPYGDEGGDGSDHAWVLATVVGVEQSQGSSSALGY